MYASDVDRSRAIRISKLLSLALRHEPAALGITLDAAGWTDVSAVLLGLAARNEHVTYDDHRVWLTERVPPPDLELP